jgi:hypothetical protein
MPPWRITNSIEFGSEPRARNEEPWRRARLGFDRNRARRSIGWHSRAPLERADLESARCFVIAVRGTTDRVVRLGDTEPFLEA